MPYLCYEISSSYFSCIFVGNCCLIPTPFCFGEPAGDQYLAVWRPFYGQITIVAATWLSSTGMDYGIVYDIK